MTELEPGGIRPLITWAEDHATKSHGVMIALPYDPEKYPGQDGISVPGQPNAPAVIDTIASVAQPLYPECLSQLEQQEKITKQVSMIGELLVNSANVVLVTPHSDLIDIAVAHAALYSSIRKLGFHELKRNSEEEIQTAIIISKMVSFLAYKLGDEFAPCTDVLRVLETQTFLSYPKTESTKKHLKDRLLPNEVDRHNKHMRQGLIEMLGKGGVLLGMAPSGTTDKIDPLDASSRLMGPVGQGTIDLLMQPNTYVVPMIVSFLEDHALMELADIPRTITAPEDVHNIMHLLATHTSAHIPNQTWRYNH